MKAAELCNIAGTINSLTREIQTKLNFKFKHTLGPQNTGQIEVKVLLTAFNRINVACFTIYAGLLGGALSVHPRVLRQFAVPERCDVRPDFDVLPLRLSVWNGWRAV